MGCVVTALFCQQPWGRVASGLCLVPVADQEGAGVFLVPLLGQANCASHSQACWHSWGLDLFLVAVGLERAPAGGMCSL